MTGFVADLISVYLVETGPTSLNISIKILLSCPFFSPLSSSYLRFSRLPVRAVIIDHTLCVLVTV